jgi:protoporphyrin/coproporphyrin ferrochelatase
MSDRGVLLMTYGSPADDLHDLPEYLAAVRGGREPSDELVGEFRRRYEAIGGSPLIAITRDQAAAVEAHLRKDGVDAAATVGMRFSAPTVLDGLRELVERGCERVSAVVMSPQHSELLMAGYRRAVEAARDELGSAALTVDIAPAWYREADFVGAVADRIREALDGLPPDAPVLLTAHSLPRRIAEADPNYLSQLRETAELVAADARLAADRWHFCWQSAGHEPGEWMEPDISDLLPQIREAGHRAVLVAPVQFLADHLEVLYDIDIAARRQAEDARLMFRRIESLNVTPRFIAALVHIARAGQRQPVR